MLTSSLLAGGGGGWRVPSLLWWMTAAVEGQEGRGAEEDRPSRPSAAHTVLSSCSLLIVPGCDGSGLQVRASLASRGLTVSGSASGGRHDNIGRACGRPALRTRGVQGKGEAPERKECKE
ncbi:hypothetical protein E2C01_038237 [Portunus trituberculatus]|uniref:Uncharacterized protein n=1 Tax=Portunus trituberculatus TaxID=210409 RepID=A0A5B7FBP3_PORTR|nr:hypothetical protein [Portunus trituberculatus]